MESKYGVYRVQLEKRPLTAPEILGIAQVSLWKKRDEVRGAAVLIFPCCVDVLTKASPLAKRARIGEVRQVWSELCLRLCLPALAFVDLCDQEQYKEGEIRSKIEA